MLEAFSGVGLILGPLLGSAIYTWLGFKLSFLVMGLALLPLSFIIYLFLKRETSSGTSEDSDTYIRATESESNWESSCVTDSEMVGTSAVSTSIKPITNTSLLSNRELVFACLCGTLAFLTDTQLEPIFSTRLEDFEMSTFQIGLMFTIIPASYIPSMFIVQKIKADRKLILCFSALFLGLATFFNGPSKLLHMPDSLSLIMLGQSLSGVFIASLTIPALPQMIRVASDKTHSPEQKQAINTLCGGLFNASMGVG